MQMCRKEKQHFIFVVFAVTDNKIGERVKEKWHLGFKSFASIISFLLSSK